MGKKIKISPITRLEGHGTIDILLNDEGNVQDAYLQVVELRGFEKFCEGRYVEELPRIMPKICGVCPGAHHMASAKATDAVYGVKIPSAAKKLRELFYNAHIAHSHILHFFALGAPDFIVGPDADPAERNILGLVDRVGKEFGLEVIKHRGFAQKIQGMIAGHPVHPVSALPGGMSHPLSDKDRDEIEKMGISLEAFAEKCLDVFAELILKNEDLVNLIAGDTYKHETYYSGLVDKNNKVNFYDGKVRVVAPDNSEHALYDVSEYLDYISEHVEPWSYLKFPFLKKIGWKGFTDGSDSGVFRVNALARLNVASGMATPKADAAYKHMFEFFGCKPVHNTLAFHWSRLIEAMFACEEVLRLSKDPEITSTNIRNIPENKPTEGVGVVEAARGTLIHHYETDANGITKKVNLIVATVQNNAGMCMSIKKAAQAYIKNGKVDNGILDRVEMAFRAYDPCLACATHTLFGKMPLEVNVRHKDGFINRYSRNLIQGI